ncbi:MAG: hypothetical protein JXR44_05180 [Thiotrichales bacterium]|nr:hypothetical protein [Thiotrichales bacterium]
MAPFVRTQSLLHPVWSYSLVIGQFLLIGLLFLTVNPLPLPTWAGASMFAALILGLWAVKTMHLGHFNIVPDPMPDLNLVSTGPYRWIRHPMYASLLLFFLPWPLLQTSLWSIALYFALWVVLLLKLHYEEFLLCQTLKDYPLYQKRSKKLLPYLF